MDVYECLSRHNLELQYNLQTGGEYIKVKRSGNLLFVSGHGPETADKPFPRGKVGRELTLEQGQEAARACALNILGCLHNYLGDLNRVKEVVKLLAFVNSDDSFCRQPEVINMASEVFIQAFGESGRHARSAIGSNSLPGNIPVEIEAIFELAEDSGENHV